MRTIEVGTRVTLRNLLFLTDFSEASEVAIPFVSALAREHEAKAYALHVLSPLPFSYASPESAPATMQSLEEDAEKGMEWLHSQLFDVPHETMIVRGESVWSTVEKVLHDRHMDLVIVGTHGRTGAMKLLLGSVAEEIFRSSSVPVLTIGPSVRNGIHGGGQFHRVLLATDFRPEALVAAPYAISIAEEHQAKLILLHVMRNPDPKAASRNTQDSVANIMHQLYEIVPEEAELWCRPEATVRFGNPTDRILEAAEEYEADLIVLGVRGAAGHLRAATHLERTTAHKVVVRARCPVLTVRG